MAMLRTMHSGRFDILMIGYPGIEVIRVSHVVVETLHSRTSRRKNFSSPCVLYSPLSVSLQMVEPGQQIVAYGIRSSSLKMLLQPFNCPLRIFLILLKIGA